jgi:hypothetical protein
MERKKERKKEQFVATTLAGSTRQVLAEQKQPQKDITLSSVRNDYVF